jgi:hypothetical protein
MAKSRSRHTKRRTIHRKKNIILSTTGKVTKRVTSGINKVGKTVTGTGKSAINRFFGLFGMKKTRKHRRK